MKKNVLFYSAFMGYNNGAEMMLKYIILNISKINPLLLSGDKGEMLKDIPPNIPFYILPTSKLGKWGNRFERILKKFFNIDIVNIHFKRIIKKHSVDLIVINSVFVDKIVPLLKNNNIPFILYLHDLPLEYNFISIDDFKYIINNAKGFIGCSQLVCENLKIMGCKNVKLFYEGIDFAKIKTSEKIENEIKGMGYSYIFAMSGYFSERKGVHIIREIALYLKRYNAALVWMGLYPDNSYVYYIKKNIENLSIDNLIITGLLLDEEYYSWLNTCDAFLLTSMRDPYPLVMLEAAYLQKPIIAFNSGGVTEFVKEGMGKIVPYYCVNAYLDAIRDYIEGKIPIDKELLRKEAERHDITKRIGEFEDILLSFIE